MAISNKVCVYYCVVLMLVLCQRSCEGADSKQDPKKPISTRQEKKTEPQKETAAGGGEDSVITLLSRNQFEQLAMAGKHMIVQFGSPNCQKCKEFQKEYEKLSHILIGEGIGIYRVDDATLTRQYGVPRLPTLIYFRSEGLPVMYFGELDGYAIAQWVDSNTNQITVNLFDDTFEHLTQASTGATTGNWMVNFCKKDVPACFALSASWEGAAARLQGRANFAYVDPTKNELLKRRFKIGDSLPVIMLFRQGKQYIYELPAKDPASLAVFAETGYQHAKGSPVSLQASPFDTLVERLAHNLKEFTSDKDMGTLYICFGAMFVIVVMVIALVVECCYVTCGSSKTTSKEKKSK
ncbi:uncharacterized protein [Antedon mediterranea]|uniref:uncharacterized protein n=1 Tax=Antedon mediterranea TaxID=105859 RepID=UPI003AF46F99